MRRRVISVLAIVSTALIGLLLSGYFSEAGIICASGLPPAGAAGLAAPANPATSDFLELMLQRGRIAAYFIRSGYYQYPGSIRNGIHLLHTRLALPDGRRSLWEYDAHFLSGGPGMRGVFIFAFPIWCALLPCLIAPILWLRGRSKPTVPTGFPVALEQKDGTNPSLIDLP